MSMLQMERDQIQTLLDQRDENEARLNKDVDELSASLQVIQQRPSVHPEIRISVLSEN